MKNKIVGIFCISLLFSSFLLGSVKNFSSVNLRGYGKVQFSFQSDKSQFICQNNKKADILFGKLLADLFWDTNIKNIEKNITINGKNVLIYEYPTYGCALIAQDKNKVIVIGAKDEQSLITKIKQSSLLNKNFQFIPTNPYPVYLDFYDLRAFKSYVAAMSSVRGLGLRRYWPFVKKFGLGGLATQSLGFNFKSPAPGVVQWTPVDYAVNQADKNNGLFVIGFSAGGEVPLWVYNQFPFSMMRPSPTTLLGAWGHAGTPGAHYQSWGMPENQMYLTGFNFANAVIKRYNKNPAIGGWHIYAGSPGAEMVFHDRTTDRWDYSYFGEKSFREYLKDVKHYNLRELGVRWYNEPGYFKRWRDVNVPDINGFFGNLTWKSFLINKNWKWLSAGKYRKGQLPVSDAKWINISMPPSQEQAFFPWEAAYYKTTFNPEQWLSKNSGKRIYLICTIDTSSTESTSVWINGKYIGPYKSKKNEGPFGLDVTNLILPKTNTLILRIPNPEGKILGPVFLTTTRPAYYPYLGEYANARYVDFKEWQKYALSGIYTPLFNMIRSIDPNRPIILSSAAGELADIVGKLAAQYGLGVQFTGQGGWYYPWITEQGYITGYYGTSEPGGDPFDINNPKTWMVNRMLGWILENGESNFDLYYNLEDYMILQKKTKWFTHHKRLIQLFGKSVQAKPGIVLFRSANTMLLDADVPYVWDIGRGELQMAHYANVYATEYELKKELINGYPVLFDTGTEFMNKKIINEIKKYVEKGGTFVALQNTGENTFLRPDVWPISELTGFKVIKTNESGIIKFGNNLPIFKGWEGKEFEGEGSSIDYLNRQWAKKGCIGMKKEYSDVIPLARWSDGTIAIGMRKLGKGKVIILGSTFWRSGKDVSGEWESQSRIESEFFHRLFTDLGVKRNANADSPDIWTRKFITKNGLQDWLIAFNSNNIKTIANLMLRVKTKPEIVWNMLTKKPVEFTYNNGWVEIKDVPFKEYQTRIYGVKRADLIEAIPQWWSVKTKYWKVVKFSKKEKIKLIKQINKSTKQDKKYAIPFYDWKFFPDKNNTISQTNKWEAPNYNDSQWQTITKGLWTIAGGKLKDYYGTGLYRAEFTIPKAWQGHKILLGLYSFNTPIVYDTGEFYINGDEVTTYQARGWSQTLDYNITNLLNKEGENVLAVKVKPGKQFGGIGGAIWIMPEITLNPYINLSGKWTVVKGNYRTKQKVNLHGTVTGKYLVKNIYIPEQWDGKNIYLHIKTLYQWLGSVIINGEPINYNLYLHPFGLIQDINLTPYIKFGQKNKIELWPDNTASTYNEQDMEIKKILIGENK